MSSLLRLKRKIKDFLKSTSNLYVTLFLSRALSFSVLILELKQQIHSYTPVVPCQNGQNVDPFSDQRKKTTPFGTGHTYMA